MAEKANSGTISKLEAVRRAMHKLGIEAGRQEIHDFVKKAFGIEMSLDHVSTYRGDIRRKVAEGARPAGAAGAKPPATVATKPPAPKPATAPKAAGAKPAAPKAVPPRTTAEGNGKPLQGLTLADIQTAKELLGRIGVNELKALLDLLAR